MTVDPAALSHVGLTRPLNVAADLTKSNFVYEDMTLFDLFAQRGRLGHAMIDGLTFTRCRIEGPAVMLVLPGTIFDAVNFGESRGDIGNMVLRPVRNMAIGTIPVVNCHFINCEFRALGFTGNEAILEEILSIRSA